MKAVSSISFFRQTQTLDCTLMQMEQSDLPLILQFQQQTFDAVEDKDTFVPLSEQEWRYLLAHGFALGVFPAGEKTPAYLIGCLYPPDEENLGHEINLPPEKLGQVAHLEIAMADPNYRGWKMHSRMCELCVEQLRQDGRTRYVMSTVAPHNLPSRRALEHAGLHSAMEKEKYGGKLRCIMLLELADGCR